MKHNFKVYILCRHCGREILARKDAVYCSQKCRQAAYRKRKSDK